MNRLSIFTKFLLMCAGVDCATMGQATSSEVNKYKIIGTCVLIPALIAVFSGFYAAFLVSKSLLIAAIFAPCWAFVIYVLDRAVVSGTRPGHFSFGVFGRIMLAVVIAFTLSEPFIIKVFEDAIEERQLFVIKEKQSVFSTEYDVRIEELEKQSQIERTKVEELQTSFIGETDGTSGSKVPNRGPIADIKEAAYLKALNDFNQNEAERKNEISILRVEKNEKHQLVKDKAANGLLGNMIILSQLSDEQPLVLASSWFLRLFFLCLELIPILVKLSFSKDSDLYNKLVDFNNETCLKLQFVLQDFWMGLRKKEQEVLIEESTLRLTSQNIENVLTWKLKDYDKFLESITIVKTKHLKLAAYITEKVDDVAFKKQLLAQLSGIYNSYMETLDSLVAKSNQYNWKV